LRADSLPDAAAPAIDRPGRRVVFGSPLFEPIRHGSCVESLDRKKPATAIPEGANDDLLGGMPERFACSCSE
jgi:hypothetical protein